MPNNIFAEAVTDVLAEPATSSQVPVEVVAPVEKPLTD